jgi:hypothetical protein
VYQETTDIMKAKVADKIPKNGNLWQTYYFSNIRHLTSARPLKIVSGLSSVGPAELEY